MTKEQHIHNEERKQQAQKLVKDMLSFINQEGMEPLIFAITNEHRTHQQTIFRMMVGAMSIWCDDYLNNSFDLRNEATVTGSYQAYAGIFKDFPIPYI